MSEKIRTILEGLNPEQLRAVQTVEGPVLIVAGAGSGKTKVLTCRVAYLLEQGCDPSRILALTFTRKAAGEMKERIAQLVGDRRAWRVVMGTFHSVFVRFLREYAGSLGYPDGFTIYDISDSQSAIKACVRELKLDEKLYKPREVLSRISFAKNGLFTPDAYIRNPELRISDERSKKPRLGEVFALYQQKLKQNGVMDFDDILLNMNILLRDNKKALEDIAARFSYIMVDEYQDTNYAQYLILKKLAAAHRNICVVGDDSQSIYAFRGAKIENILNFRRDYPESETIRLERNYRSTGNIVDAANSLIAHNEGRIPKKCYSEAESGEKIHLLKAYTEDEEAMLIVSDIISRMQQAKAHYEDFAILYRTNAQSRAIEEQLRRRNLPYMIYSGNSFFERAEIKDMMAYFKLAVNPSDDESFKRAVNQPARGIGGTSMEALGNAARTLGLPLFKAALADGLEDFGLRPAAILKIRGFCRLIDGFTRRLALEDAYLMAKAIADGSGLYAFFKQDVSIEGMARAANLEELLDSVAVFVEERKGEFEDNGIPPEEFPTVTMGDFLENNSLLSNVDVTDPEDTNNKVALMTVHSAKGLEFPFVYVAGMEENLFPGGGMMASPADIEEERRLFYVALTRAQKAVSVSFAGNRMRNGRRESNPPSRFVREIDPKYISNPLPSRNFAFDDDDDDSEARPSFTFGSRWKRPGAFASSSVSSSSGSSRNRGSSGLSRNYGSSRDSGSWQNSVGGRKPAGPSDGQPSGQAAVPGVRPALIDPGFVPVPMTELYEGERIEHNRFGAGKILEISGTAPELKAKVQFDGYGLKLLLLKYAKMRPEKKE